MKVKELMTTGGLATLTPHDSLELAAQVLLWGEVKELPVVANGRVVGTCGETDLLGRTDLTTEIAMVMRTPAVTVGAEDDLATAAASMATHFLTALPVVDAEGGLIGQITSGDLLRLLVARTLRRRGAAVETVGGAMTCNVVTTRPGDTLIDAASRMRSIGVRHLPVLDGDGCLVGILSDRDLRAAVGNPEALDGDQPPSLRVRALKVRDVMSRDPITTSTAAPLEEAGRILVEHRIGALPVTDDGRHIVGMLSYVDYIRATTAP